MTGGVVLSMAVGGRRSRPGSGARLGLLAGLGWAVLLHSRAGLAGWLGRAVCGRKQQAGSGGWRAVLLLLLPVWARSGGAKLGWFGYSGQMPLFFFLYLLFLFYFLFLSYSMPWVDNSCIDLIKIVG